MALDFLYETGFDAFWLLLAMNIPFILVFVYIIYRKGYSDPSESDTEHRTLMGMEISWMVLVVIVFVGINLASIGFMPPVVHTTQADQVDQEVNVTAFAYGYQISDREYEVGTTVTFIAESADTVHSFAVYDPDGNLVFTQMLIPGMTAEMTHTFDEPGTYTIRCLEYCGFGHHQMRDELVVTES